MGSNSAAQLSSVGPLGFNSAARDVVGFSSVAIASCRSIKLHVANMLAKDIPPAILLHGLLSLGFNVLTNDALDLQNLK